MGLILHTGSPLVATDMMTIGEILGGGQGKAPEQETTYSFLADQARILELVEWRSLPHLPGRKKYE